MFYGSKQPGDAKATGLRNQTIHQKSATAWFVEDMAVFVSSQ